MDIVARLRRMAGIPASLAQEADVPATPSGPAVDSVAHDEVSISWSDPADSRITGYQVLRRTPAIHDHGEFEVIDDDTGSSDTTYTDVCVAAETKYVYWVKARNAHGLSNQSGYVSTTTPAAPNLTPETPCHPRVESVTHNSVTIAWSDPGDSSITGYQVLRRNPAIHVRHEFEVIEDDTASSDTRVAAETKYFYRLKARNIHGLSEWSKVAKTTTQADPTPANSAPTGLPTIAGTAQVGETLTAATSGISDANGLGKVKYTYQWMRNDGNSDTKISGATGQTYTLTSDDQENAIKVEVSFTDDDGYSETLTSNPTGSVATSASTRDHLPERNFVFDQRDSASCGLSACTNTKTYSVSLTGGEEYVAEVWGSSHALGGDGTVWPL